MALGFLLTIPYTLESIQKPTRNMTTLTDNPLLLTGQSIQPDYEIQLLTRLSEQVSQVGMGFDRTAIANFYVALKSKPLAILAGPAQSGKIALVQCLAHTMMGGDCQQCQVMVGHPWSFGNSENLTLFIEAQMSYNTEKLLGLIEEARRPGNAHKVYIACITRISPAELLSFFTEVSYQLRHGQLMRFGDVHFSEPVTFPPNLFLIGTMDTERFDWWDRDLLANTIVIQTAKMSLPPCRFQKITSISEEQDFLCSRVRSRQAAYSKIHAILRWQRQPLKPLIHVEALLSEEVGSFLYWLLDETIVYLANSWSRLGNGLFAPSTPENLAIALDLAFSQILLPGVVDTIRRIDVLREQLHSVLAGQFPRSNAFTNSLAE